MKKILLVSRNCADLWSPNIEMKNFPDGENYVRIPNLRRCRGREVLLLHRCYPNQDSSLMQLLLMLGALKGIAKKTTAVVPYLPYARQDKIFLEGEAKSAEIICSMLRKGGCDELVTFDCHFLKKIGNFTYGGLRIKNLSMRKGLLDYLKRKTENPLIISPDMGASYLVEKEGGKSMKKERGRYMKSGRRAEREIKGMRADFEMEGRNVIIIDDIIAGGGTMKKAIEICKKGGARNIFCGAAHGLFLEGALGKLRKAGAKEVIVSNSIPSEAAKVDIREELKGIL